MTRFIRRNWLVVLGLLAFAAGIVLQVGTGKIDGSVLIPLPMIYAALLLREPKKSRFPTAIGKAAQNKMYCSYYGAEKEICQ